MKKDLAVELIRAMQLVQRHVRQKLALEKSHGFSMSQIRTLSVLAEQTYSLSDLADFAGVDITSMSRMIQVLEKRGLVSRRTGLKDRRRVDFELTAKGMKAHLKVSEAVREELRGQLKILSNSEAKNMEDALGILRKIFEVSPR